MIEDNGDVIALTEWVTVTEAAKLADYRPGHIRRLARQGVIKTRKVGHLWLVNKADLLAYKAQVRPGRPRKTKAADDN